LIRPGARPSDGYTQRDTYRGEQLEGSHPARAASDRHLIGPLAEPDQVGYISGGAES
jgi:hypothetical protein